MAIVLINKTIIKPSPSSSNPNPSPVLVPLTIFDKAAFNLHINVLYAFRPPLPSNEVLKNALSKVLVYFPHLAGRFTTDDKGCTCIFVNNAGVRLIDTYLPINLSEQLPFEPSKEQNHLLASVEGVDKEFLLLIQLNRYACTGLVIGITAHHRVADGQSMGSFFVAWARLVRGLGVKPLPYHDRVAITVPRNPPIIEFNHSSIEFQKGTSVPGNPVFTFSIEKLFINFSSVFINKLKAKIMVEEEKRSGVVGHHQYSTFECLLAHLWKRATQARDLKLEEWTQVRVAVNGRARMKPPVPMEFFGNLVLWAYPRLRVKEVLHESHAYIAKAIHDAVARLDHRYFQSFIDFGSEVMTNGDEEEIEAAASKFGNILCPDLEVDSWLRFQFHERDFGGGSPCAIFLPIIPLEGLLVLLPSCSDHGGVDVLISLLPQHTQIFKQISHSLD